MHNYGERASVCRPQLPVLVLAPRAIDLHVLLSLSCLCAKGHTVTRSERGGGA